MKTFITILQVIYFIDNIILNLNEGIKGGLEIGPEPFILQQNVPVPQNGPDFVDDYLDMDQQSAVTTPCGDVTFDTVVGEAGEGEWAVGPHIETWTVKRLDDPTAKSPASVWSIRQLTD